MRVILRWEKGERKKIKKRDIERERARERERGKGKERREQMENTSRARIEQLPHARLLSQWGRSGLPEQGFYSFASAELSLLCDGMKHRTRSERDQSSRSSRSKGCKQLSRKEHQPFTSNGRVRGTRTKDVPYFSHSHYDQRKIATDFSALAFYYTPRPYDTCD